MKWIKVLENRLFPNESPYQRTRRRGVMVISAMGAALLVMGAMMVTNYLSGTTGRTIEPELRRR
jgi:hypothetical protein